jgi:hypothetical protein
MEKLRGDFMDENGYTFTPMTVLLFIPIMIIAVAYGNIVNEANMLATLATGGDVTFTASSAIFSNIEKGALDGGRNAAYNATRKVIDSSSVNSSSSPFFANGTSKNYVKQRTLDAINTQVINASQKLEQETGREIFINNIPINNYTNATFTSSDVNITQTDPFGFFVNIRGGIPIRVVQKGQVFEGSTPPISTYVTLEGLEDPYVWVNTKFRQSNVIYRYSFYSNIPGFGPEYYFQQNVDKSTNRLYHLWDCLNGTDNPSNITPRPNYFVDSEGLSFFDRLENRSTSADANITRMSTFILGDVLQEDHNNAHISIVDWEYFKVVPGYPIEIQTNQFMYDPMGSMVYLSNSSKTRYKITY